MRFIPRPLVIAVLTALAEMRYGPRNQWHIFIDHRYGPEVRP